MIWAYLYIDLRFQRSSPSSIKNLFYKQYLKWSKFSTNLFKSYCDSKTFASRFWLTMSFTGWLHLGSNISDFSGPTAYISGILNIFYCSNFQMTCERSYNWNAWLTSSPACSWFGFNKKMRFTAGVTSEKLQSRPIMTKLDPTQPGHMHATMIWNGKIKK